MIASCLITNPIGTIAFGGIGTVDVISPAVLALRYSNVPGLHELVLISLSSPKDVTSPLSSIATSSVYKPNTFDVASTSAFANATFGKLPVTVPF